MKKVIKNIVSLYGLSIAKIIFPLIILPYLTRVLSVGVYGIVSYVKTIMIYMQLIVDFGFMVSGTRDIVACRGDSHKLGKEMGDILIARLLLSLLAFISLVALMMILPILRDSFVFTVLSYINVFLSIFLFDYLFRGIEKMHIITARFFITKTISTFCTFALVRGDSDVLWIPALDIIGSLIAIIMVWVEIRKMEIKLRFSGVAASYKKLKKSAIVFASYMATTVFGALNTILIGAMLTSMEVAYWSVCMQFVSAVQAMYTPINDGIYPEMIKNRDLNIVKKTVKIMLPIIIAGCLMTVLLAKYIMLIFCGRQYLEAAWLLQGITPVLFFSFPAMLLGWPTLGAINKNAQVTSTTIFAAIVQLGLLLILIALNSFSLKSVTIARNLTEVTLLFSRLYFFYKMRDSFEEVSPVVPDDTKGRNSGQE